ncbi:very short patch repair endonuclease [Pontibacter sp. BT310]|uniref:Very short patch repair endonuclease n=1 Tax=Pontibacter populi TaxID=890055 RepID=A0ABS6XD65_9BACT|nr:very short patch repair endonuclease [Pontibacter sp. BT310]MBR0571426.1 very short patch repair endonuclease [Microvirga sp. STS03]MBW3365852.1 very short patch repair endonuclease [Pontibacter populi]
MKKYSRDARSPVPKNENTSKVMRANSSKNTKPEMKLRSELFHLGLRGYRVNHKELPGRPDVVFTKKKVAIFVNGCYWHRCPICNLPLPKHNTDFWSNKFERNVKRDQIKKNELEHLGYKVVLVWECEIKSKLDQVIEEIRKTISS